jgi:hypothetical protein
LTNPDVIHAHDIVKGFRHFVQHKDSIHREAFEVYACRVMHALLRVESMMDDYLTAAAES